MIKEVKLLNATETLGFKQVKPDASRGQVRNLDVDRKANESEQKASNSSRTRQDSCIHLYATS